MRQIGNISEKENARVFGDFLTARGIDNEVEPEADSWSIWIRDEDHISEAVACLGRFSADPGGAEFLKASDEATRVRTQEAEKLAEYRRRIRSGRNLFPKIGGYGVGFVTYALIFVCVAVAVYSKLGSDDEVLRHWFISDPETGFGNFLPEVRQGEVWRLFTSMFIHFGPLHLIFNLMWLYQLGCMIEARQGPGKLLALVAVAQVLSAVAQYRVAGPAFGGMSGVVYALAGYVWMRGKYDRASGLFLDRQSVTMLLIWLVICFTPVVGHVANAAHVIGLAVGVIWGRVSAYFAVRRPE
jgi:GlpG protein